MVTGVSPVGNSVNFHFHHILSLRLSMNMSRLPLLVFLLLLSSTIHIFAWHVTTVRTSFANYFKKFIAPRCYAVQPNTFQSCEEYVEYLKSVSKLPLGFSVGATRFLFQPREVANKLLPMNLTAIVLDEPTESFAAAFTSNKFPGGPILVGKERLTHSKSIQAVIINNKISNVCPSGVADFGFSDSNDICKQTAKIFKIADASMVLPSSTGIIGWRLPVQAISENIPLLQQHLQNDSVLPAALGIMTTDRYPKVRRYDSPNGGWSIVGIAKGAGMIEPNLATMLSYVLTDLKISRSELERILKKVVTTSYNTISVDGDQSTSDTVVVLSSNKIAPQSSENLLLEEFEAGLQQICGSLSEDIVRNGEGTQHVVKVAVQGVQEPSIAYSIGKSIINSNLVKCAIAGCDPNVGRIVAAVGSVVGNKVRDHFPEFNPMRMSIILGGKKIFSKGSFALNPEVEKQLSDYLFESQLYNSESKEHDRNYPSHFRSVDMIVQFHRTEDDNTEEFSNSPSYQVIGSDLTKEYVEVNADYRS